MTVEYDEQAARAAHEKLRADMTPKPVFPSPPRSKQSLLDDAAALLIAKGYRQIDGELQAELSFVEEILNAMITDRIQIAKHLSDIGIDTQLVNGSLDLVIPTCQRQLHKLLSTIK